VRVSRHKRPQGEWEVLITDHHEGFIDWNTYQDNQTRIGANTRPRRTSPAPEPSAEGCALLQGLATCGVCGRKNWPSTTTAGQDHPRLLLQPAPVSSSKAWGTRHLRVGGAGIDTAVAAAFLAALQPAALQACLTAAQHLEDGTRTPHSNNGDASSNKPDTRPCRAEHLYRAEHRYPRRPTPTNSTWSPAAWNNELNTALTSPRSTPSTNSPAAKPHVRKP